MTQPKLHIPTAQVVDHPPIREVREVKFITNEGAQIIRVMIDAYSQEARKVEEACKLTVNYHIRPDGKKGLPFRVPTVLEINGLIQNFRNDPKQAMGVMRRNLIEITRDKKMPEEERKERLMRYLKKLIDVIVMLDQYAFPPDGPNVVHRGFPAYIPDGLSDLGKDPRVDAQERSREKIRVNKKRSYEIALSEMHDAIWSLAKSENHPSSSEVKLWLAKNIMTNVYRRMPYNLALHPELRREGSEGKSIAIDAFTTAREAVSVCRHIAMETQLRFQLIGLESRLLKCSMDGVRHAANLLRVNTEWCLVDPTNPEMDPNTQNSGRVFIRPVTADDRPNQVWELERYVLKNGKVEPEKVVYGAENETYYRVLDNRENPVM